MSSRRGSVEKAEFLSHFAAAAVRTSPRKGRKSLRLFVPGSASEDAAAAAAGGSSSAGVGEEGSSVASAAETGGAAATTTSTPPTLSQQRGKRRIAGLSLEVNSSSPPRSSPLKARAATARKLGRLQLGGGGGGLSIDSNYDASHAPVVPSGPGGRRRPGGINSLPSISASRLGEKEDSLPDPEQMGSDFTMEAAEAEKLTEALRCHGVACVCIDFDRTMVCIHTYGRWHRTAEELGKYVRPIFRALVPALLRAGLGVAVVTFSKQDHQIRTVLRLVFGEEFSARIHLRTNSFKFRRRRGSAWDTGKQLHIESVIEAANEDAEKKSTAAEEEEEEGGGGAVRGPSLVMTQCALIDDDLRNINVARENGVHSHHFTNDSNLREDLVATYIGSRPAAEAASPAATATAGAGAGVTATPMAAPLIQPDGALKDAIADLELSPK